MILCHASSHLIYKRIVLWLMTVSISEGREEKQDVVWDYYVTHNPS